MTLSFRMANVDVKRIPDDETINKLYDLAKEIKSEIRVKTYKFYAVHPDVIHFNTTRVVVNEDE